MNRLLDTQALLWFVLNDSRLSNIARENIILDEGIVFVSPASLWEIAIKISLGKYVLPTPFTPFWNNQLQANDFALLPISVAHAAQVANLPYYHRDPFDRLIISQSLIEKIPVISNDVQFDHYEVERIW